LVVSNSSHFARTPGTVLIISIILRHGIVVVPVNVGAG
jgi:hypothetical protein